tara:strand:- start:725 stop:1153 length:429 start_codon:yes stop_codon:yes gene_type:complete
MKNIGMIRNLGLMIFLSTFLLRCAREEVLFPKIEEQIRQYVDLSEYSGIYVFDEYSCSICSDNVFGSIKNELADNEYIVLYAEENYKNYSYENSVLAGYVPKEMIIPANPSLIEALRAETNTYKGNYKLHIENKIIKSIKNY